jgi:hypothetical protein
MFPKSVKMHYIKKPEDCVKLEVLLNAKFVGVDSEWKPTFKYGENQTPAIL